MKSISMVKRIGAVLLALSLLCGMVCIGALPASAGTEPVEVKTFDADFADLTALVDNTAYDDNGLYQSTADDTAINEWVDARFGVFVNRESSNYKNKAFLGQGSFSVIGFESATDSWGGEINLKLSNGGALHHTSTAVGNQQIRKSHTLTVKNAYGDYAELANFEAEMVFSTTADATGAFFVSFHEQTPGKMNRENGTFLGTSGNDAVILGYLNESNPYGIILGNIASTSTKTGYTTLENQLVLSTKYKLTVKVVGTALTATVTKVDDGSVVYTGSNTIAAGSGSLSFGLGNSQRNLYSVKVTELDENGAPVDFGQKRTLQDFTWTIKNKGWYISSKYYTDKNTATNYQHYNFVNVETGLAEETETAKAIMDAVNAQFDNVYNREGTVKDSTFGLKVSYEGQENNFLHYRTAYINQWLQLKGVGLGGGELMRHLSSLIPKGHDGQRFLFKNFETTFNVRFDDVGTTVAFGFRQQEAGKFATGWYAMNKEQAMVAISATGYNLAGGNDIIGARTTAENADEDMYNKVHNTFETSIAQGSIVQVTVRAVGDQVTLVIKDDGTEIANVTQTIPYTKPGYIAYALGVKNNKSSDIGDITLRHLDDEGNKISLYEHTEAEYDALAANREIDFADIPGAEYTGGKYVATDNKYNYINFSQLDASVLEEVMGDVQFVFNDGATYTPRSAVLEGKGKWLLFYNRWLQLGNSPEDGENRMTNINALVPLDEGGAARKLENAGVTFDFRIESSTKTILVALRQNEPGMFMTGAEELNQEQILIAITKNSIRVAGGEDIAFEDFAVGYEMTDDDGDPETEDVAVWKEYADDDFGDVFSATLPQQIRVEAKVVGNTVTVSIYNAENGAALYNGTFTTDYTAAGYVAIGMANGGGNFGAVTLYNRLASGYRTDYPNCAHQYDCTGDLLCNLCGSNRVLAAHTFDTADYDETGHWNECVCGEKDAVVDHSFDNDCDTDCACGYVREVEPHVYDNVKYDETTHWNECDCGDREEAVPHDYNTPKYDETAHWNECACGAKDETVPHDYNTPKYDETAHWNECVCGAKDETVPHDYNTPKYDETAHWNECACGAKDETVPHDYTTPDYDENGHWNACACGAKDEVIPHDYTTPDYDENGHWNACACGAKDETVPHEYDDDADTTCDCGYVRTIKSGWKLEGGKWYFYENGAAVKNAWRKDSKGWVKLGADGAMLTDQWTTDSKGWCYVGADGYAVTNTWKKDSKGWIYLDANGSMTKAKWVKTSNKWYYLDANGYMLTNKWQKDSKGWVYVGADGAMVTNKWVKDSKGWCYVGANGYAVTNTWKKDSKGWIYLDANGSMTKSKWVKDNGTWYYCDANGYMVANKTITISGKKYTFNASGAWVG